MSGFVSVLSFCLYLFCFALNFYGLRLRAEPRPSAINPFCQDDRVLAGKRPSASEVNLLPPDTLVITTQTEDGSSRPIGGENNWRQPRTRQLSSTAGAAAPIPLLPPAGMAHFARLALLQPPRPPRRSPNTCSAESLTQNGSGKSSSVGTAVTKSLWTPFVM